MENAVDAIKMAFAMFVFILALTISITSFGQARLAVDNIMFYSDRENLFLNYDYNPNSIFRTVNMNSIIPTIFRAQVERYRVVFPDDVVLYRNGNVNRGVSPADITPINFIGFEKYDLNFPNPGPIVVNPVTGAISRNDGVGESNRAEYFKEFLNGILFGSFITLIPDPGYRPGDFTSVPQYISTQARFEYFFNVTLPNNPVADSVFARLRNMTFTEALGIYTEDEDTMPNAQKTFKRVITYRHI